MARVVVVSNVVFQKYNHKSEVVASRNDDTKKRFEASARHMEKTFDEAKKWIQMNRLTAVGGLWASLMSTTLLYQNFVQKSKKSTSVKVIHSRLYSQAITLGCLLASSGVEYYDRYYGEEKVVPVDQHEYRHVKLKR